MNKEERQAKINKAFDALELPKGWRGFIMIWDKNDRGCNSTIRNSPIEECKEMLRKFIYRARG